MNHSFISRIRFFSSLIVIFAIVLVLKLFFLQIINADVYRQKADRQYVTPSSNIFDRGSIFFTTKDGQLVSAATVKSGFKIAIKPNKIKNALSAYDAINAIVPLDKDFFLEKVEKKDDPYEEISHRLTKIEADDINSLGLSGVSLYKESWRFYPGSSLAAHILGFVGWDKDKLKGRYGLERQYDGILSHNEDKPYVNFFAEVFSKIGYLFQDSSTKEGDIIISIEPSVQNFFESNLRDILDKWDAEFIGGVIIDPMDGSIYALAHLPTFDLNNFSKVEDPRVFSNPLVESVFEFGSIIKPLTMAAGLDAGVVTPDTEYVDRGSVVVDNKRIYNFDKKARGRVDMKAVINQSLNTGAVFVMQKLGHEKFREYMLDFGLGEKTGIDLPSETFGLVSNLNSPRNIEYATASFGQGIAITPMEAVRAFSTLANGGTLITPHIVKEIKYKEGGSQVVEQEAGEKIITEETSEEITRMMIEVIDKSILSGAYKLEHYSIAAKTGTAQIAKEGGGGYYEDRFLHSFFGYFPAFDPEFLVLLYLYNPRGVRFSSTTLASPFSDIAKFLISYYNIPPDR